MAKDMQVDEKIKEEAKKSLEKAYNYAIYLLGLKLRTEGEIREKLRVKNYELRITEEVIKQLAENRYLDDQRYAEVYVENLKKYKNFGFFGIKKKLMEKRLPKEIIENILNEVLSEEEELKIAKKLLNKIGEVEKQKAVMRLKSKGFRTGVIMKCF